MKCPNSMILPHSIYIFFYKEKYNSIYIIFYQEEDNSRSLDLFTSHFRP